MKIILFLMGLGLAQAFHPSINLYKNISIDFEIGASHFNIYSVNLGRIMNAVCESKTKELKIDVQANRPVDVYLCNCNEKNLNKIQRYSTDELSLDSYKMKNLSLVICEAEARENELEFTVSGSCGTHGTITLEVVDNRKHSAIELFFPFKISSPDGVFVNLTEFESVSRLATHQPLFEMTHHVPSGLYQHLLQMDIEMEHAANYSATFMKCGMKALPIDRLLTKNQLTFEPGMLRMLDDVSEYVCKNNNTPLQLLVKGKINTTGTLVFRIVQNQGDNDFADSYLYPILHISVFLFILFGIIPMIYFAESRQRQEIKEENAVYQEKDLPSMWSL